MDDFKLTMPDGSEYIVTADTEQQAFAALQKMLGGSIPQNAPQPGLIERAGNWLTGANRDENIPGPMGMDLPMTPAQSAQMTALMATTMTPDRLKSGIQKIEPDVQFQEDSSGELVALWPRKNESGDVTGYMRFYPNPPGLDVSDVMRGTGAVAAAMPIGRALKAVGLPTTGLLGGGTLGATEAGLVEGASSALSDAPFQLLDIPLGFLGGVAGERVGRGVQSAIGAMSRTTPNAIVDASGNLLPAAADALRRAGLDPSTVPPAVAANILNSIRTGADAGPAAVSAMSRGLPTPVPMTRGQITGSAGQQLFEDMAGKGVYGRMGEALMTSQRQRQQEALTQNLDQILEGLRPGAAPIARGEGGVAAQEALARTREAQRAETSRLYTEARGTTAVVDPQAALNVADAMRSEYRTGFSPRTAPTVAALLDDFDQVAASGDIRAMMQWREQVSGLRSGAPTVEGTAAGRVINAFDQKIEDAINNALLAGDADAVAKWGLAISKYADFASKWKSKGGVLNLLTEQTTRDGDRVLKVAPERAADAIFSATTSGLAGKTGLARDLVTLRATLPTDEWNMMRQEAFIRLMDTSKGAFRSGEQQVSGVNFKKAWENLTEKNRGVVNSLFTPEEQRLFGQFADVAARATNTAINASNSAAAAGGIIQRLIPLIGGTKVAQFMLNVPIARGFTEALGGTRALAATQAPALTPRTPITIGGAGVGGAVATSEPGEDRINRTIRGLLAQ
jgi:hypothetical protein